MNWKHVFISSAVFYFVCFPGKAITFVHIAVSFLPAFLRILLFAMPFFAWTQPGSQQRKEPTAAMSTLRRCWPMHLPLLGTRPWGQRFWNHLVGNLWKKVRAGLRSFSCQHSGHQKMHGRLSLPCILWPLSSPLPAVYHLVTYIFHIIFKKSMILKMKSHIRK